MVEAAAEFSPRHAPYPLWALTRADWAQTWQRRTDVVGTFPAHEGLIRLLPVGDMLAEQHNECTS